MFDRLAAFFGIASLPPALVVAQQLIAAQIARQTVPGFQRPNPITRPYHDADEPLVPKVDQAMMHLRNDCQQDWVAYRLLSRLWLDAAHNCGSTGRGLHARIVERFGWQRWTA